VEGLAALALTGKSADLLAFCIHPGVPVIEASAPQFEAVLLPGWCPDCLVGVG